MSKSQNISDLFQQLTVEDNFTKNLIKHFTNINNDIYYVVFEFFVNYITTIFNLLKCMVLINDNPDHFNFKDSFMKFLDNYKRFDLNGESREEFEKFKKELQQNQNDVIDQKIENYLEYFYKYCCDFRILNKQLNQLHPQIFDIASNIISNISIETDEMIEKSNSTFIIVIYKFLKCCLS
jgi:hypothetical protein